MKSRQSNSKPQNKQSLSAAPTGLRSSQISPIKKQEVSSPSQNRTLAEPKHDSSSGTLSQSQSHLFHGREHNFSKDDTGSNKEDSLQRSQTNALRLSAAFGPECMPQPVVTFEIKDHEILKKQDYVVYYLQANTLTISWTVQLRYSNFKDFHEMLLKNPHFKDKMPSFPPKRLLRKSKDVIDERKKLLAEYMNGLSINFNIFRDEYIMAFLKQDFGSVQISNLAALQDKFLNNYHELLHISMAKSAKSTSSKEKAQNLKEIKAHKDEKIKQMSKNFEKLIAGQSGGEPGASTRQSLGFNLHPNQQIKNLKVSIACRKLSDENHQLQLDDIFSPLGLPSDQWRERKFENIDERLNSWLQEMHKNVDNQSQLIQDFQEYYFGQKPLIPNDYLKRLFYGYLKHQGILDHLKTCHTDKNSIKTKTIMIFMMELLDFNKCHQIEDISQIWKTQKPDYIKECHFELMMDCQQQVKEAALTLLKVYLDGKLFKISDLIKDEKFAQKFHVWMTNKNRHQNSFTSMSSQGQHSNHKGLKGSFNSQNCTEKPHFGPCNHRKSKRISYSNASQMSQDANQLRIGKSHSSRNLQALSQQKPSLNKPINKYPAQMANSAQRHTEKTTSFEDLPGEFNQKIKADQVSDNNSENESGCSLASSDSDSDYLFKKSTLLERKKNKRQSVQVTVPREIVDVKKLTNPQSKQHANNNDNEIDQFIDCSKLEIDSPVKQLGLNSIKIDKSNFNLGQEIEDLIKHYNRRFNLIYHTPQIEDLEMLKVLGQVNQYIFDQSKNNSSYKLRLSNFRKLIEGMRPQFRGSYMKQVGVLAPSVTNFFAELHCETVKVIDDNNRLIKYSSRRKVSLDFNEYLQQSQQTPILNNQRRRRAEEFNEQQEHLMLVSYQITGVNKDKASISLFEFDDQKNRIVPSNFIIITQSFGNLKSSCASSISQAKPELTQVGSQNISTTGQPNNAAQQINCNDKGKNLNELPVPKCHAFDMYRTLSAVTEDCDGEEVGSVSINTNSILTQARTSAKKSQFLPSNQGLLLFNKYGVSPEGQNDDDDEILRRDNNCSDDENGDFDQDKLLLDPNFVENRGRANSFSSNFEEGEDSKQDDSPSKQTLTQQRAISSAKASISTSKSSNADPCQGQLLWTCPRSNDQRSCSPSHKFDEILQRTYGDVSVIMRISDDQDLLQKILVLFKGLANQINMSLHGIKH